MSKRKYKPGSYIISLDDLMKQDFVYCAGKLVHKGWFGSWQLRYANSDLLGCVSEKLKKSRITNEHWQAV